MMNEKTLKLTIEDEKRLEERGYKLGTQISSGSFARVFRALHNHTGPCAAKVIDLSSTSEEYRLKFLPRELYTMKKLKHPNVINILDIFAIDKKMVVIFMELAEGGDLLDLLREEGALNETRSRTFFCQFGDAIRYMHGLNFAHRDIKCENILLNRTRTIARLTDFGFARTCFDAISGYRLLSDTYCGSAAYVAPEVLKSQPYSPLKSDVWSCGIVLFVLLNNRLPFSDTDNKKLAKRQTERKYNFSRNLSTDAKELINHLLNPNPIQRPSMTDVFTMAWFINDKGG